MLKRDLVDAVADKMDGYLKKMWARPLTSCLIPLPMPYRKRDGLRFVALAALVFASARPVPPKIPGQERL